ncbi:hypothetical protein SAMN05192549_11174 [Duganella sacchari]|uniref:Uncharacterized protein n=1 Tax=Duganella sacchari TaxID=551987 RepID=A0A1M7R5G2_9BURK|nr:hypothetical protein [Duganella sacchari]SHN40749.1 hypothetical protein SAMN05192549_11174 [Duganella sacchari]
MKKSLLLAAALLLSNAAHAAEAPRKYGILSLVGDSISTITYVPETGTKLDANDKQVYSLGDNTFFDEAAIRATSAAIQATQPEAGRFLMLTTDAELHKAQNTMFDEPSSNQANRDFLKTLWKDKGLTHVILVTKYRADTDLKFMHESGGTGKIEGLGFYMDNLVEVVAHKEKSSESTQGVLMPFAYIKLRLIDADTLAVQREVRLKQSELVTYAQNAEDRNVRTWAALSAKEKSDYLDHLLRQAVTEGIPRLLKP